MGPTNGGRAGGAVNALPALDRELGERLAAVCREGRALWRRFDADVRSQGFHPFVAADYDAVLERLIQVRAPGLRFLEWGSATGVITILADLLGYEAWGIELDARLVDEARALARRHGSGARFSEGSFLPAGYRWRDADGDERCGTIGHGASGYERMGLELRDFHVVFAYPWAGEAPMMKDVMRRHGDPGARLLVHGEEAVSRDREGRVASRRREVARGAS